MTDRRKWEYQIIEVKKSAFICQILSINGEKPKSDLSDSHEISSDHQLYLFLNELGQGGWELIASSLSDIASDEARYSILYLFLKRAI